MASDDDESMDSQQLQERKTEREAKREKLKEAFTTYKKSWGKGVVVLSVRVTPADEDEDEDEDVTRQDGLDYDFGGNDWKTTRKSKLGKYDNTLTIPCELNKRYVVVLGPTAIPFWKELVRKVNNGNGNTFAVRTPDGHVHVHLDVSDVSIDKRLDGSAQEPFVTPSGEHLDIGIRYKGEFVPLPPSFYSLDGKIKEFKQVSKTVSVLGDAGKVQALLNGLKTFLRPPQLGANGGGGADGSPVVSLAGNHDEEMEDATALAGRRRRDSESQDSSPRPGGPYQAQQLQNVAPKATKRARVSAEDSEDAVPAASWSSHIKTLTTEWGYLFVLRETLLALPKPKELSCANATADQVAAVRNHIEQHGKLHVDHLIHLGVHDTEDGARDFYIVDDGAAYAAVSLLPQHAEVRIAYRRVNGLKGALSAYGEVTFTGCRRTPQPFEHVRFAMQVFIQVPDIRGACSNVLQDAGFMKQRISDVRRIYYAIPGDEEGRQDFFAFYNRFIGEVAEEDLACAQAAAGRNAVHGVLRNLKLTWELITLKELWQADPADRERGLDALLSAIRDKRRFRASDMRDALAAAGHARDQARAGAAADAAAAAVGAAAAAIAARPAAAPTSRPQRQAAVQASQLVTAQLEAEHRGAARDRAETRDVALQRVLASSMEAEPQRKPLATMAELNKAIELACAEPLQCGICHFGPKEAAFFENEPNNVMLAFGCDPKVCGILCRACVVKYYSAADTCSMCRGKVKMQNLLVLSQERKRGDGVQLHPTATAAAEL